MEQLGIEPVQLGIQIFNFTVMVILLTRFLYKPILKILKDRKAKIEEGLAYAEKTKVELEKTESKRQTVLAAARDEARTIIEESKKAGKQVEADIIEKAHEEAQAIVEKARIDIESERVDMERKLKEQTVDVASAIAAKVLQSALSVKNQRAIIERKIRTISKHLT